MRISRSVLCLSVVALAAALSACGSSGGGSTSASAGTGGGTSSSQVQARLNLAKCFRAHGINVPDPSSGGPAGGGGIFRALNNYPQAQVNTAQQACRQYFAQAFPRLNLSPAQRAQVQQQIVKFAQCMRSHAINIPDPTANGNAGFGFRQAFRSIDRNSPAFQSASKACSSLQPRFGRGAAGGPPGGAPGGGAPGGAPGA